MGTPKLATKKLAMSLHEPGWEWLVEAAWGLGYYAPQTYLRVLMLAAARRGFRGSHPPGIAKHIRVGLTEAHANLLDRACAGSWSQWARAVIEDTRGGYADQYREKYLIHPLPRQRHTLPKIDEFDD